MLISACIYRSMLLEKEGNNIGISIGKEEVSSSNLDIGSLKIKGLQNKYLTILTNKGTLGEQIGSFLVPFFFSTTFLT